MKQFYSILLGFIIFSIYSCLLFTPKMVLGQNLSNNKDSVKKAVYYTLDSYKKKAKELDAYNIHDSVKRSNDIILAEAIKQYSAKIIFCGIDFSLIQIVGEMRTAQEFIETFARINNLFLSEPDKYDVLKYLAPECTEIDYDMDVVYLNNSGKRKYTGTKSLVTEDKIAALVKDYKIDSDNGIGIVIIADLWNKGRETGSYHIVKFDIPARKILSAVYVSGKASGFGLRNYWANTVYTGMKKYRKM